MPEQQVSVTTNESRDYNSEVTDTEIAQLAYSLWQSRGCPEGSPDEDWFRAEAELRSEGQAQAASA